MIGAIMQIMEITRIHTELSPPELPKTERGLITSQHDMTATIGKARYTVPPRGGGETSRLTPSPFKPLASISSSSL